MPEITKPVDVNAALKENKKEQQVLAEKKQLDEKVAVYDEQMPDWARQLYASQQRLEESNQQLLNENKMLKAFAGENKIKGWKEQQTDKTMRFARLKKFNNKVVVGWSSLDRSLFNPNGRDLTGENLFTELTYLDGSKERVNYGHFVNGIEFVSVKIESYQGNTVKVQFEDESISYVELSFLNP